MKATAVEDNEILEELRAIKRTIAAQYAAVLCREEAALYIGISSSTLERITSAGLIRSIRITEGRVGWTRKALDAYIESRERSSSR